MRKKQKRTMIRRKILPSHRGMGIKFELKNAENAHGLQYIIFVAVTSPFIKLKGPTDH